MLRHIDENLPIQIITSQYYEPVDEINIHLVKFLGRGGQAEVYECSIDGLEGQFATKFADAYNNEKESRKAFNNIFAEFAIAADLNHPNIIAYKYFKKDIETEEHKFNIIMEYMDGCDMGTYIKKYGPPSDITRVKSISRQLLSAIKYLHEHRIIH